MCKTSRRNFVVGTLHLIRLLTNQQIKIFPEFRSRYMQSLNQINILWNSHHYSKYLMSPMPVLAQT